MCELYNFFIKGCNKCRDTRAYLHDLQFLLISALSNLVFLWTNLNMENTFRYVFNDNLYRGYWQPLPGENGKRVFRISYPDHADQYGECIEIIETGDRREPYKPRKDYEISQFFSVIIKWFADYKLLSS